MKRLLVNSIKHYHFNDDMKATLHWNTNMFYKASVYVSGTRTEKSLIVFFSDKERNARYSLSIVKAWVGEIPCAPYISTEMIAHDMIRHVIAVNSTHGTVIHLRLTVEKDWLQQ